MNKLFLSGNLTKDPELTETSNGTALCRFAIAVNRKYAGADGERKTDFFNCTAWRGLGETIARYAHKGDKLNVVGSVELNTYENKDKAKCTGVDVVVSEVEFLTPKTSEGDKPGNLQAFDDDGDLPI